MDRKEMLERLEAGENPLEVSIQKWQDIVDGKGKNDGAFNCALCLTFRCKDCPVTVKTGGHSCHHTPYYYYILAEERGDKELMRKYALEELIFLKSLRGAEYARGS
jgi:hypothetical protein